MAPPVRPDDSSAADSAAIAHELLARLLEDRERGLERSPQHYRALFPGHEALVERELAALREPDEPGASRRFGRYLLRRELGRGGQGVVYLAEDPALHREVALKVLPRIAALSPHALARLRREAEAASRLDHPGICTVFEAGELDGAPYIAMRHVPGRTLREELDAARALRLESSTGSAGRAHVQRVVRIVEEVARALHHAHEHGLVHRDVKPANILVTPADAPVVLDFGLARDLAQDVETLTASGDLLGTPAYLSPEQLRADPDELDRRTDVYSLGVTLYEALALRRPFEASSREALYRRILADDPPELARLNRNVPAELAVVVETALEKDRERRYRSALELAEDLRRVRERQPIHARPAGPALRARRWVQRNPAPSVALALLFAGLVVAGALLLRGNAALRHWRAAALADASSAAQRQNGLLALQLAREAVRVERSATTLSQLHAALAGAHEGARLEGHSAFVLGACFAPDGEALLTWSGDGTARVWSRAGQELARCGAEGPPGTADLHEAGFSPDGARVVTASIDGAARVFSRSGELLYELPHGSPVWSACFSPDGALVLTGAADGAARLFADGALLQTLRGHAGTVFDASFSRDGRSLVTASADGSARIWERAESGRWEERAHLGGPGGHAGPVFRASVSPDGERVLTFTSSGGFTGVGRGDGSARVWNRRGALLAVLQHEEMVRAAEFSPSGERVLTASDDGTGVLWDLDDAGAATRRTTLAFGDVVQAARWSPDERLVLLTGPAGRAALFERGDAALVARPLVELTGHSSFVFSGAFAGDGRRVVTTAQDGTARLWELHRPELPLLAGHGGRVLSVAASPRWIASVSVAGKLRLWSRAGELAWERLDPPRRAWRVAFSPREDRLAVAFGDAGPIQIWSMEGSLIAEFAGPDASGARDLAFSPDGERLLLATGRSVCLYGPDGEGPRTLARTEPADWMSARFSPDGERIVAASWDKTARIWSVAGEPLEVLRHEHYVNDAAFLPCGRRVVTACTDSRAYLWDLERGPRDAEGAPRPTLALAGHEGRVVSAEASPDGARIVTASEDGTARLWSVEGELLAVLRGHGAALTRARFTPDGARVLTSSDDGTVRTWVVDAEELLRLADRRIGARRMTPRQRERFAELLGRASRER